MPKTGVYEAYCPVAKSLDVLGERWTLLIVRDLLREDLRFTDLRQRIVGIPPNVLSQRLKSLTTQGLVTTRQLDPPAARTVYSLTEEGRRAAPVIRELIRFGMPRLDPADDSVRIPRRNTMAVVFAAHFDQRNATKLDGVYMVDIEGRRYGLHAGNGTVVDAPDHALVSVVASRAALLNVRNGTNTWDQAVAAGDLVVVGSKSAVARFRRAFRLDP